MLEMVHYILRFIITMKHVMWFMEQYQVQLRSLGERCKLLQWGLGRSPSGNQIRCILALKSDIWWHEFFIFHDFSKKIFSPDLIKFPDFFQFSLTCRNSVKSGNAVGHETQHLITLRANQISSAWQHGVSAPPGKVRVSVLSRNLLGPMTERTD